MSTGSPKPGKSGGARGASPSAGDVPKGRGQLATDPPTEQHAHEFSIENQETEHRSFDSLPVRVATDIDPNIGRVISGRYRVLSKLGEGGMGKVYLAEHIHIEKRVALKVLSDDFARKADLVARFMQEAKAASRIGHENIVDITDFGETDAGSVFFAMEHLEGSDLATVIRKEGPLPLARAIPILTQICRALGAAHSKGIIHRDVKPENIFLVERDGKKDFVKILDFGIAKMSSLDESGERLTRTGMIFGTPEYMSPEQARGDRSDHRVDIYAVGCIAYEMLTGDVPFHAETFMGVLTKHMFEMPTAMSVRAPEAQISADVEQVVQRALAKNRDERYQNMRELALAFGACEGGEGEQSWGQDVSGQYHAPQPQVPLAPTIVAPRAPARRRAALFIVALGLGLAGVAGFLVWHRPQPTTPVIVSLPPSPAGPPKLAPAVARVTITSAVPAEVRRGDEVLGNTPGPFALPFSKEPVPLTVVRAGYKPTTVVVRPDHDATYVAQLEADAHPPAAPTRPNAVAPKKTGVAKKSKAEALAPSPMPPVESSKPLPPPKPANDLKDPGFDRL